MLDGNNNVVKISNTKMKIRIALPEDLKGYDKYEVVYIVNDEIKETIPAAVENGYIVFETNHLSQYGIIATNTGSTTQPTDPTKPAENKPGNTTSPKTGDNSNMFLWLALLLASSGAGILTSIYGRKKKRSVE